MPPAGAPRPEAANLNAFAAALENGLDTAAAIEPYVDVPELHRVNRTEYGNAVRDLLDLEVDVAGSCLGTPLPVVSTTWRTL